MDATIQLVKAGEKALEVLEFDRRSKRTSPRLDRLCERRRHTTSRQLRAAIASTVTGLDTAVMHDLMRIVKRLSKSGTKSKDKGLDRLKLTLELMEMAVKGAPSRHPDHLIWLLKGLEWVSQREWTGICGNPGGMQ